MSTVRENLIAARSLIDTPEKWGKGMKVSTRDPRGCQCAMTAVKLACGVEDAFKQCRSALLSALPHGWRSPHILVSSFNDASSTTHADIMALFDRAIEAAS